MGIKEENILDIQGVSKSFPGVKALNKISFTVKKGEVRALSGENGAGKSTLIKILTGVYTSDSGQILFEGKPVGFHSTYDSQNAGIRAVFQELNLIPYLSVAENLVLEDYPMKGIAIDWKAVDGEAARLLDRLGLSMDPHMELSKLGAAAQQMISIAIALRKDCKLMILDEPTSSLDKKEVEILFSIIRNLKDQGVSFLFITHRLEEIFQICDSVTILKDGECVGTYEIGSINQNKLVTLMVGREVEGSIRIPSDKKYSSEDIPLAELEHARSLPRVWDVNLMVYPGEILGVAGLLGSGRSETAQIIAGCRKMDRGVMYLEGKPSSISGPVQARRKKIVFCTENRRVDGIVPNMSVRNNMILCSTDKIARYGFINEKKCRNLVNHYIERFKIKTPSHEQGIKYLSGGNQQKVLLARGLATGPKLVILDEPTRGIDVGAKQEIMSLIREIALKGIGVIFISSDLSEVVSICDRVTVIKEGKTVGELTGGDITQKHIMDLIADSRTQEGETDHE